MAVLRFIYMQNNQIIKDDSINDIKDDSSSRDKYYNDHVACIVFGNKEFKEKYEKNSKEENKTIDELVGTDFLFGKYLNFETNEEEWQQQLKELTAKLNDPKFANLKGIKFVLDEHGGEGENRSLAGYLAVNPPYYKSKRFQQVAKIINKNFLNKNQDNKLYFVNTACYGAYFFNELKKNVGNDIPRSNNIYEILSNTFGKNRTKVYCSQLKPEIGPNHVASINPNRNPFRNTISFAAHFSTAPSAIPSFLTYKDKKQDTDLIKQFCYEGFRNIDPEMTEAPYCKIYFPLTQYRDFVPNALCLKPNGPKEYRDIKICEKCAGLQGKIAKNKFFGRKSPTKANKYHNNTTAKDMMSAMTKDIIHEYNQKLTKQRKEQEAQAKKASIKAQEEYRRNHISFEQANHYMAYPFQYYEYNMFS